FKDAEKNTLNTTNSGIITVIAAGVDNAGTEVKSLPYSFNISEGLTRIDVAIDRTNPELSSEESANVSVKGIYGDSSNPVDILENTSLSASPSESLAIQGTKVIGKKGSVSGTKVTLTATCGGVEGKQDLTIKERDVKSLQINNANSLRVDRGENLDLSATATFAENTTDQDFKNVTWRIRDNDVIPDGEESRVTINEEGLVTVAGNLSINGTFITVIVEVEVTGKTSVK